MKRPPAPPVIEAGAPGDDLRALKDLCDRQARVMARRPELARSAGHARVRLSDGPSGVVAEGDAAWVIHRPAAGVARAARVDPAQLLRASLVANLALDHRMWGARLEIPMSSVEVELHTEDDARGQLLLETDVSPGWQRMHIVVTVVSAAPLDDVARVVDCSNRHCLVLATLSREIERTHQLRVLPERVLPERVLAETERTVPSTVTPSATKRLNDTKSFPLTTHTKGKRQ